LDRWTFSSISRLGLKVTTPFLHQNSLSCAGVPCGAWLTPFDLEHAEMRKFATAFLYTLVDTPAEEPVTDGQMNLRRHTWFAVCRIRPRHQESTVQEAS
jgi:hypothetical protein